MIKESNNLTGSDIANMLGIDAVDAYNSSKAEEKELEETIETQKKNDMRKTQIKIYNSIKPTSL